MTDLHERFVESQGELFDERRRAPAEEASPPDRMLRFFRYDHLPKTLQDASRPFCQLAQLVVERYPMTAERTVCLRKLLEAKDAAVRSALDPG